MHGLKEAFLGLVRGIKDTLTGTLNIGQEADERLHDRIDFLLIYILLGFSAYYAVRELGIYQVIHEEYIRGLAEKELHAKKEEVLIPEKEEFVGVLPGSFTLDQGLYALQIFVNNVPIQEDNSTVVINFLTPWNSTCAAYSGFCGLDWFV